MKEAIEHGGALDKAMARYGGTKEDWLDLSTGINPEAFALPPLPSALWNRLPDEGLLQETLARARLYYGVGDQAGLVAAPGTQALIQLLPTLLNSGPNSGIEPATVAVLTPTYQEHARCFAACGWKVVECATIADIPDAASVVVIVNPNNPDGRLIARQELLDLAEKLESRGGFLIVDEAFADADPAESLASEAGRTGLLVLKSFGKFFGLAGVRLGFVIGEAKRTNTIAQRLGPWAVSGPTLAIARHAFSSTDALKAFHKRLNARRQALAGLLARCGLKELGGTALFALVEHEDAQALHTRLCERHILVRKFAYAPHWLRIGLALEADDYARLEKVIQEFLPSPWK